MELTPRMETAQKWADRFIYVCQILTGLIGIATGIVALKKW